MSCPGALNLAVLKLTSTQEADYLQQYRQLLAGEADFLLPELIEGLNTANILAMTYVDGVPVESLAQHSQSERNNALQALRDRLTRMDLSLNVSTAALSELAKVGFDPVFGARPLKRAIQQRLENPLSRLLLEGRFPPKCTIEVSVDPVRAPGQFDFQVVEHAS